MRFAATLDFLSLVHGEDRPSGTTIENLLTKVSWQLFPARAGSKRRFAPRVPAGAHFPQHPLDDRCLRLANVASRLVGGLLLARALCSIGAQNVKSAHPLECAVLAGCQSYAMGHNLLSKGIPVVVAWVTDVSQACNRSARHVRREDMSCLS